MRRYSPGGPGGISGDGASVPTSTTFVAGGEDAGISLAEDRADDASIDATSSTRWTSTSTYPPRRTLDIALCRPSPGALR